MREFEELMDTESDERIGFVDLLMLAAWIARDIVLSMFRR